MYYELRTYKLKVGTMAEYMRLYEDMGYEQQVKYLGEPVGFFQSEIGSLNILRHVWAYESLDLREEKRALLFADPQWLEFLQASWPLVLEQTSEIMRKHQFPAHPS